MAIYLISDTHFFHDRAFIWEARGFTSLEDMHKAIITNWNHAIDPDDDVYMLGDFFLGADYQGIDEILNHLHGKIHFVIGNHDTDKKIEYYKQHPKIVEIGYALCIRYNNRTIFLSHYPTLTSTLESDPKHAVLNMHGHIHTVNKFYEGRPYMYNVGCDVHNCKPVLLDDALTDIQNEIRACIASVKEDD